MYPLTSRSFSGILIIFLVFSEIQGFITKNDTSYQFCSNVDNVSTKECLQSVNDKGGYDDKFSSFGGLSNRLQELPDLPQETPELESLSFQQEKFMETKLRPIRKMREKRSHQQISRNFIRTVGVNADLNRKTRSSAANLREETRSISRGTRSASQRISSTRRSIQKPGSDMSRRSERHISQLRLISGAENRFRNSRSSTTDLSENRRERGMNFIAPDDNFRLFSNRINAIRYGSESQKLIINRESLETPRNNRVNLRVGSASKFRESPSKLVRSRSNSIHLEKKWRASNDISENRGMNMRASEDDRRSANRESRSRSEARSQSWNREPLETRRNVRHDAGVGNKRRSREDLSNLIKSSGSQLPSRSSSRIRSSLTNSRGTETSSRSFNDISENQREMLTSTISRDELRQVSSRSSSNTENRFRSSRGTESLKSFNRISENRQGNARVSADENRSINRIREMRYRSEPRSISRIQEKRENIREDALDDTSMRSREDLSYVRRSLDRQISSRSSPNTGNRFKSSRGTERNLKSFNQISENRREERLNDRISEDEIRSMNRIREMRYRSEPRSISRIQETRRNIREDVRDDTSMRFRENSSYLRRSLDRQLSSRSSPNFENRFRNSRETERILNRGSENRRGERLNDRISEDEIRSMNRIRKMRYRSEPQSISGIHETRRNIRENARVDTSMTTHPEDSLNFRRSLDSLLPSRSSLNADNRFRSVRSTERSLKSFNRISENQREEKLNDRKSEDEIRSMNRIREMGYRAEPRSISRIHEIRRNIRENARVDNIRSLNTRTSADSFRFNRMKDSRTGREFSETRDDRRRSRERASSLRLSGSYSRSDSRLGISRSTEKDQQTSFRNQMEREIFSRFSTTVGAENDKTDPSQLRTQKHESSNRIVSFMNERNSNKFNGLMVMQSEKLDRIRSNENKNRKNEQFDRVAHQNREISRVLDSSRSSRNIRKRKMMDPIFGEYSRKGEPLESVFPKEASIWIGTTQISLIVVLLGQLFWFNPADGKNRFSAMHIVRMLRG